MKDKPDRVALTETAVQICRDHYDKQCGRCPIRPVCVTRVGPGQDALNAWTQRINEYAESIAQ